MTIEINPYAVLGVVPDASLEDIRTAYRRAIRRLHPDRNHHPGAAVQFQDITAANDLLSDESRRREYDRFLQEQLQSERPYTFTLRVIASRRAVMPLPETQVVYLLADIFPDSRASQSEKREARVNLALVLDRSNSMSGARIEKVKVAAHQIIDRLTPQDIFSVVAFDNFGEVIVPATPVTDKPALKARVSMMMADGGTEIYQGLSLGVEQVRKYLGPNLVNHVLLLTDGNTFGDQDRCIALAESLPKEGIAISAMGLGHEWNDKFLDQLASVTGGTSKYIQSAGAVVEFLNEHVRNLSNMFAERVQMSIAPDVDVKLESAFRLAPNPQPLTIDSAYVPLGGLQVSRSCSVLLQLEFPPNLEVGFYPAVRLVAQGDIMQNHLQRYQAINDLSIEVTPTPMPEETPSAIMDALGKFTLYRIQERAQDAVDRGDVEQATRSLGHLATRLFAMGEDKLAAQARAEANHLHQTSTLSEAGRKVLKYQTRHLMLPASLDNPPEKDVS